MAKLDKLNREFEILKLWLGIIATSIFGLIAWIVIYFGEVALFKTILGVITLIFLYIVLVILNETIKDKLDEIEKE